MLHLASYMVRSIPSKELESMDFQALVERRDHILNQRMLEVPDIQALDKAHVIKEYQTVLEAVKMMIDEKGALSSEPGSTSTCGRDALHS